MKQVNITCIVCPKGCNISVSYINENNKIIIYKISGNQCKAGLKYAEKEIVSPMRTLTTTVKTIFKEFPRIPVKTDKEIPLKDVFKFMKEINKFTLTKKVSINEIILKNVLNSKVNVISTIDMKLLEKFRILL